jgi:hypothetical protein
VLVIDGIERLEAGSGAGIGAMAHPTPAGPGALAWLPSSLPPNVRLAAAVGAAPATATAAALLGSDQPQAPGELGISERDGCLLMRLCGPMGGVGEEVGADDARRRAADPLRMCAVHGWGGGCRCGLLHQAMALRIGRRVAQRGAKSGADSDAPSPRDVVGPSSTLEMLLHELGALNRCHPRVCLRSQHRGRLRLLLYFLSTFFHTNFVSLSCSTQADALGVARPASVEAELGECGVLPDELDQVLRLLACVNGGIEESRLAYSLKFDLLKLCWVLDALEPIIIRAAGMLLVTEEVRVAIDTRSLIDFFY